MSIKISLPKLEDFMVERLSCFYHQPLHPLLFFPRWLCRSQTRPPWGGGLLQHGRELSGPAGPQRAPHRHRERELGDHGAPARPRHPHGRRLAVRHQEGGGGRSGAAAVAQETQRREAGAYQTEGELQVNLLHPGTFMHSCICIYSSVSVPTCVFPILMGFCVRDNEL